MRVGDSWRKLASSDLGVLVLLATAGVLLHAVTNGRYGFHRDELATLDDACSLAWGYVAYPPLTPFLARIALILFGPSLIGLRFFAAVALGLVLVLTGLMARHLGGGRQAQIVAHWPRRSAVSHSALARSFSTLVSTICGGWRLHTSWFACLPQTILDGVSLSGL